MCGIVGIWDRQHSLDSSSMRPLIQAMADTMRHRGPDSSDIWVDPEPGIAFGHRRIAIVDLSSEGSQPMASASGRHVVITNGEIYNFIELRRELEILGHAFRGHSDTEVMVEAIERWGVEAAVKRIVGMFAFACWDRRERRLTLGRDRLGKKPLFVGKIGSTIAFASELKALSAHPHFERRIEPAAVSHFMERQFIPAPMTIWQDVRKLPGGQLLTISASDTVTDSIDSLLDRAVPYWDLRELAAERAGRRTEKSVDDALDELDALVADAVSRRMIADVPLGAFLSGGIDSTLVVAMMQKQAAEPVKTFTIGFGDARFNEAGHARDIAAFLGTEHHEAEMSGEDALAIVPELPELFDEPLADPSQIPTLHVARFARESVTVCLTGDGGDESFAGYGRYAIANRLRFWINSLPSPLRRSFAGLVLSQPANRWNWIASKLPLPSRFGLRGGLSGDRLHKAAQFLKLESADDLYAALMRAPATPGISVLQDRGDTNRSAEDPSPLSGYVDSLMLNDQLAYLPDDVLVKVDRATMAASLEARCPLLDHLVVEWAWSTPLSLKMSDGKGKWLLRRLLARYLPDHLVDRPKRGFGVPVADWLRGPLREWAGSHIDDALSAYPDLLDAAAVKTLWAEHLSGERDWNLWLWNLAMFQAWGSRWNRPSDPGSGDHASRDWGAATALSPATEAGGQPEAIPARYSHG